MAVAADDIGAVLRLHSQRRSGAAHQEGQEVADSGDNAPQRLLVRRHRHPYTQVRRLPEAAPGHLCALHSRDVRGDTGLPAAREAACGAVLDAHKEAQRSGARGKHRE